MFVSNAVVTDKRTGVTRGQPGAGGGGAMKANPPAARFGRQLGDFFL